MKPTTTRFCVINVFLLIGILAKGADANSAALDKLRSIPAADPKWEDTMNFNDRNVPLLTLSQRGAFLNGSQNPIPFDQVLTALAELSPKAWGHGRFLIFFPFPPGIHSTDDHDPPDAAVKEVLDALKSADIKINHNFASS